MKAIVYRYIYCRWWQDSKGPFHVMWW